jgi:hypothetical protein
LPAIISLKMLGLAGVLSYAAARLAVKAGVLGYNRYTLVAVPVHGMPEMPRGFRVVPLDAAMLARFPIDVGLDVQSARFDQGMVCLGAFNSKDELVGVNWLGAEPFTEDEVHVRFAVPVDAVWDTGLWVKPQYRLGRGFAALWAGTALWLMAHGRVWSMSRIADYNLPSILSHRRMGALTVGHITAFRVFRWQFMSEGVPRRVCTLNDPPALLLLPSPDPKDLGETWAGGNAIRPA